MRHGELEKVHLAQPASKTAQTNIHNQAIKKLNAYPIFLKFTLSFIILSFIQQTYSIILKGTFLGAGGITENNTKFLP